MSQTSKLALPSVTLLVIDTINPELAFDSMERSLDQVSFASAVLVTRPFWKAPTRTQIKVEHTSKIESVEAYSFYILADAIAHVETDHVLIAQWDSFVLNPSAWSDTFLVYDYIGAPWPDRPNTPVGNGGFSLRSRRLMRLLSDGVVGHTHPEDVCICVQNRSELESKHGVRFATVDVAGRFAFELEPRDDCFGFHGVYNFHRVLPERELLDWLRRAPDGVIHSRSTRALAKGAIKAGYYAAARFILQRRLDGTVTERLDALKLILRLAAAQASNKMRNK